MPTVGLADRLFLTSDSTETPQHVAALGVFSPPIATSGDFVTGLAERFRATRDFQPPFNYRLRRPRLRAVAPSWQVLSDEAIDLEFHFRHDALPRPGGQRELGQLISRLHSRALDPTRPLWELHLIEGLDDGRFALYFKVHHALMDGVGGVQRFTGMVTADPSDDELRPIWTIGPRRRAAARTRTSVFDRARRTAGAAVGLTTVAAAMGRELVRPSDPARAAPFAAPRSALNGPVGRQRRIATQIYEFERIRAVASTAAVTVNDVFLAICAGGLRRYLAELGEPPDRNLVAGTPVSVRIGEDDASTNAFTMTVMKLGTEIADPLERLAAIHRSSTLAKAALTRLEKNVVENQAALFMGPFIAGQLTPFAGHVRPPYNVSISSVPGPIESQYLAGARLESLAPLALIYHGIALFIAAFTISGTFTIGFVGDRDSLPHMQRLATYTGDALEELEAAVPRAAAPPRTIGA